MDEPHDPGASQDAAPLTDNEVRVLGCLIEKEAATPEVYPLTLNALQVACNQKTSRDPVMQLDTGEVGQALHQLEKRALVRRVSGARADRWEHRAAKTLELVHAQQVLLGLLLLRGPQTLSELFTRSQRMHAFDDTEQVAHQLSRLAGKGLVMLLPRQSGQREDRYLHRMAGEPDLKALASLPRAAPAGEDRLALLEERVGALEAQLAELLASRH
ncbi:hypothetical protein A167_00621 [Alcanivorax sp. S71-1-4]|uniref:YceH family protein n=1 Tax=Alcanivorax sp. S71-1-4 TaxID=1177159 RepID=UPI00135AB0C3|nr:DUF480 domain-containing protein [Alcanivorax sp. S71-1-4]KAF0810742.1 hypothetical protein A167_00621 [Alcanivorax sp. S71-1-4]